MFASKREEKQQKGRKMALAGVNVLVICGAGISEKRGNLLSTIAKNLGADVCVGARELCEMEKLAVRGEKVVVASPSLSQDKLLTALVSSVCQKIAPMHVVIYPKCTFSRLYTAWN
jgi:hypothetical protein